ATPENYQRVLRDIHARAIQMWAGCIWVPIYEVMTRKHLTVVTLDENLELAADIGLDATTSLDDALAAALARLDHDPRAPADVSRRTRGEAHERDPVPVRPLRRRGARASDARRQAPPARCA